MRLLLAGDDGTIVDSTDSFSREEFLTAQRSMIAAADLIRDLNPDAS